jgi:hypothetical protein
MSKIIFFSLRSLLGVYLILLAVRNLSEINYNKVTVINQVESFEKSVLMPLNINIDLNLLKQHPIEILYFQNLCIMYGGFLMVFGFGLAKAFITIGFIIEFLFLNNIFFNTDEKSILSCSLLFSIFGGVLNVK